MRSTRLFGKLAKDLAARMESASGWPRTLRRIVDGFVEIEIVDRSMTLAAQIFTSVLPVLIAGSFLPYWDLAGRAINDQLGFDTEILVSGVGTFTVTDPTFAAFGVVGLLMVLISGTSFAKALARIYAKIWNVPSIRVRNAWRWLVVLLLVAFSAVLLGAIRELTGLRYVGVPLAIAGELAVWMLVWTISPYLLTMGKLSGRVLWMTGALTASGLTVVRAAGRLVLPRITDTAYTRFGLLGPVFTSISWLFVLSAVVVGAATITKALALDESPLGRYLRGPATGDRQEPQPTDSPAIRRVPAITEDEPRGSGVGSLRGLGMPPGGSGTDQQFQREQRQQRAEDDPHDHEPGGIAPEHQHEGSDADDRPA